MKKVKAIFSIAMIGILMFSTLGFSVSRHYCMGMLVAESFYTPPASCSDMEEDDCGPASDSDHKGCCDDEILAFAGIDVLSFVKKQLDVNPLFTQLTASLPPVLLNAGQPYYERLSYFPPPPPHPYGRTLLVQVQRFLI